MRVRVLAFARLRELLEGSSHELDVPAPATIADVWDVLAARHAELDSLRASTRVARNGRMAADFSETLAESDELTFLPPVGGG